MKKGIILFIEIATTVAALTWWLIKGGTGPFIALLSALSAFLLTLFPAQ